jgi:outer membrane protein OmpA-like peptidoglycan-associated protein
MDWVGAMSNLSRMKPRDARRMVQATGTRAWVLGCMAGLLPLALGACSSGKTSMNPVDWWRDLQGGKIAEERPPPPGTDDPNPNLGSIPERPTPTDPKFREQLANALIADRTNARHVGGGASDPSNPASAPGLFGRGTAPPPGPAPAAPPPKGSAAEPAETPAAPPAAAPTGVASAPVGAVQATPLAEQAPAAEPTPAELPALPASPPASANLPGAPSSAPVRSSGPDAAAIAAGEAPATAAAAMPDAAPAAAGAVAPVNIAFGPGSATLPRGVAPSLRQLAAKRGGSAISVTGYGDATSREPSAQSAALALGLARGQAIANALVAAGVPANIIRVDAEASGRGGTARLVE